MVQTLEAIRGGGGSVKVGAVGTISALMTRELESSTPSSNAPSSSQCTQVPISQINGPIKPNKLDDRASSSAVRASMKHRSPEGMGRTRSKDQHQIISSATPKRQKQKVPSEYKDNSSVNNKINGRSLDFSGKTRSHKRNAHISILSSENSTHLEKTPLREKSTRKGSNIVDIVDSNCGNSAVSLSSRLKKLGLSRMSQSFM